jgi:hypothetical protein
LKLASAGIDSYLFDEYIVQLQWTMSNAYGGVRLMVDEADVEAALKVLSESPTEPALTCSPCPECQSSNTCPDKLPGRLALGSMLVFQAPVVCFGRQLKCQDCNHTWNAAKQPTQDHKKVGLAWQFIGAQLMIAGGVILLLYLISLLILTVRNFNLLHLYRDSGIANLIRAIHDSYLLQIPLWLTICGLVLFCIGAAIVKSSLYPPSIAGNIH